MLRRDNPELKRKMLDHLADLYKIKEVRESNHLSSYITCRTRSFLDSKQAVEPTDEEVMLFALGYGLQDVLTPKDADAPVIEVNGILYRPDMILDRRLNEIKTTRKSAKYHYMDDSLPLTWVDYMMGGCFMRGNLEYDLIILYMMGDYCLHPDIPVLMSNLTWRPIGDVRVHDILIGVDEYPRETRGARRKLKKSFVTATGIRKLPSRRLYMSDGRILNSSIDHLWLVQQNLGKSHYAPDWKSTKNIVEGDRIRQLCPPWSSLDKYDYGWLAGILDGEGSLEHHHGMREGFSQKDNIVALQAQRILDEELNIYLKPSPPNSSGAISYRTPNMASTLKLLGSVRPVRLLQNLRWEGVALPQCNSSVTVDFIEELGEIDVIAIGTSTKTLIADGFVSHNSPPFPDIYAETELFELPEITDNWNSKILPNKAVLDKALATGVPPEPFKNCYDWECKYCRYKLVCQTLARAGGITMTEEQIEEDKSLWE